MRSTKEVVEHHLESFGQQDLESIMEDYTDSSFMIYQGEVHRGTGEIEHLIEGQLYEFSVENSSFSLIDMVTEGNVGQIMWSGETPVNTYEFVTDTFIIEGESIAAQTVAGNVISKE